jgi:hypothetical protein
MNCRVTRLTSLGLLVSALAWACSTTDEGKTPGPDQTEVGGTGVSGGASSTHIGAGGSAGIAGAVTSGRTGTNTSAIGSSQTTGGNTATAGVKTSSGGTPASATTSTTSPGGNVGNGGTHGLGGTVATLVAGASSIGGSETKALGGTKATGGSTGGATGTTKSTGGNSSGDGTQATGGSKAAGGATGTTKSTGGNSTAGGTRSTGGTSNTGGSDSSSPASDGCSDTLALGVTLGEVAVFQSGKISVMQAGAAVTPSTKYGADIVEGRPTLFRAYVTVDSGFQSRQLSARLIINDGASTYYSKQTISASSTELSATNSFPIAVSVSDIAAGLNYSIKIVECATGSGAAHSPQFPAIGQASLATRLTGPIKVKAIPVTANNITPALDQNFASSVKAELEAMYPTTDVQITLDPTPITGCAIAPSTAGDGTVWSNCLDLVRSRRTADRPASDVYYLGVLTPATTLMNFCGNSCIAGISYQVTGTASSTRASLAIGYLPDGLDTMAHELGHAHGLAHSPGCGASSTDANFPYVVNGKSYIGWVGWDSRTPGTFLDPAKVTDIMAYCTPQWVSDYVYSKWEDRVATVNGNPSIMGAVEEGLWRVLNVVNNVPRWGIAVGYPEPPSGEPEGALVLDLDGQVIQEITVYRTEITIDSPEALTAASYMIPEPADTWDSVVIADVTATFQR